MPSIRLESKSKRAVLSWLRAECLLRAAEWQQQGLVDDARAETRAVVERCKESESLWSVARETDLPPARLAILLGGVLDSRAAQLCEKAPARSKWAVEARAVARAAAIIERLAAFARDEPTRILFTNDAKKYAHLARSMRARAGLVRRVGRPSEATTVLAERVDLLFPALSTTQRRALTSDLATQLLGQKVSRDTLGRRERARQSQQRRRGGR